MNPKFQSMDTPKTRAEFELRFHHLKEALEDGKLHFPASMGESLLKLKMLPNGRLDFLSVDEMARLHANTMFQFPKIKGILRDREEQDPTSEE